jgi:hypothetical protein
MTASQALKHPWISDSFGKQREDFVDLIPCISKQLESRSGFSRVENVVIALNRMGLSKLSNGSRGESDAVREGCKVIESNGVQGTKAGDLMMR